jgi:hypothetical protein
MLYSVYIVYAAALMFAYWGSRPRVKKLIANVAPKTWSGVPRRAPMCGSQRFNRLRNNF